MTAALNGVQEKLNQVAGVSGQASTRMASGMQQLSQQVIRQVAVQGDLSKAVLQTGQAAQTQQNAFQRLYRTYLEGQKQTASLTTELRSLMGGFRGLAAAAGIGFSVSGLIEFTRSVVDAGLAHDRLMLSLKGALGSAQAAGEAYQFVEGVANRLGIGLLTAGESFAKLTAATQGTVVQGQETRDLFVAISEASRVMGLRTEEVGGVVTALTQIIGKGTVSMEELRQQLGERLPSALRLTAQEMGVTTSKFIEMVSKGEVLATDFIPAVTRALRTMGAEAPAAAASVAASLERMGNAWLTLKVTIAQSGLLELVARIAEEMSRTITDITNFINRTKRLAGEMGLQPMIQELNRLNAEIEQTERLVSETADAFAPLAEQSRRQLDALKQERNALHDRITAQQVALAQAEKTRTAADAAAKQDFANAEAKQKEIAALKKAADAWIDLGDGIAQTESALNALRSFDVPSLQALQIDPFAPDFERKWNEAEAFLLKRLQGLKDKQAGINRTADAKAAQQVAQGAANEARVRVEALAAGLKQEELRIAQSFDERRRAIDAEAAQALAQNRGNVEAIAQQRQALLREADENEAVAREAAQLHFLGRRFEAEQAYLQLEIAAHAKQPAALAKFKAELLTLETETEAERQAILKQSGDVLQQVDKRNLDEQIKNAREANKLIEDIEQDRIRARIDLTDEQINLVQAQVEGELITRQEGIARIQALETQRLAQTEALYRRETDLAIARVEAELGATEIAHAQILKLRADLATKLEGLDMQRQVQQQQHQNELTEGWRGWARDVQGALGNFLFDWASGEIDSIKDVLDDLKRYFFRLIADMIAYAAAQHIIIPITASLLGGILGPGGGAAGGLAQLLGGLGGGGGTAGGGLGGGGLLQGAGVLNMLFGPQSLIGGAFSKISAILEVGAITLRNGIAELVEGVTGIAIPTFGVSPLTALGGLGGLGAGLFQGFTAPTTPGQIGGFLGAAGGGAALLSGLGLIAPIFGPIGLAVAALMPLIGTFIGDMIKEKGPRLVIGALEGLSIAFEEGALRLTGDLSSRLLRRERLPGDVREAQNAFEERTTEMIRGLVNVINAVAVDSEGLLAQTQQALNRALNEAMQINTSSARNFSRDIAEQTKFVSVQIASFFLEPLNAAAEQLLDADLPTQVQRFVPTMAGLADVFRSMNSQIEELSRVANTDVLRHLSSVRNRVENFGNQIVEVAGQLATEIVDGVTQKGTEAVDELLSQSFRVQAIRVGGAFRERLEAATALRVGQEALGAAGLDFSAVQQELERLFTSIITDAFRVIDRAVTTAPFDEALRVVLAIPDAVIALNPALGTFRALAQAFAPLVNQLMQDIATLEATVTPLRDRLAESAASLGELEQAIKDAGTDINVALPLYDEYRREILESAQLQIQAIQEIAQAWEAAMGQVEQSIAALESEVLNVAQRLAMAQADLARSAEAIAQAAAAGDTVAAIQALQEYAAGLETIRDLAIQTIEQQRQAWIDAQQDVIDTIQAHIDAVEDQMDQTRDYIAVAEDAVRQQQDIIAGLEEEVQVRQGVVDGLRRQVEQLGQLRERVGGLIRGQAAPPAQAAALRAEMAAVQQALQGATGEERIQAFERLIALNEELMQLGEQTDQLGLIREALDNLVSLQAQLTAALVGTEDALTVAEQQLAESKAILEAANAQLAQLEAHLAELQAILAIQERQMEELQVIQEQAQQQLQAIQASTYWTEQIAKVNTDALIQLYAVRQALIDLRGPTTWEDQILAIQRNTLGQLVAMTYHLQALYAAAANNSNYAGASLNAQEQTLRVMRTISEYNLKLPIPMTVTNFFEAPRQKGGLVGLASGQYYARGGMVPVRLEPHEQVFLPPLTTAQQGALMSVNRQFPRFGGNVTVPGYGSGDTVHAQIPMGSMVMNRNAAMALGYASGGVPRMQAGGMAHTGGSSPIVINVYATPQQDVRTLASEITRLLRREIHSRYNPGRPGT